jgi:hypothetical protein
MSQEIAGGRASIYLGGVSMMIDAYVPSLLAELPRRAAQAMPGQQLYLLIDGVFARLLSPGWRSRAARRTGAAI